MDLIIIGVLSLLLVPLALLAAGAFRLIIGLAFVLFFTGYSLVAALFPKKSTLNSVERLALSFGLSIAVVPLIGLILNYTTWGIRLGTILISLLLFVMGMLVIARYRRQKLSAEERFQLNLNLRLPVETVQGIMQDDRRNKIITGLLVLSIVGAIGTATYVIAVPKIGERYTEFYINQTGPQREDPPRIVIAGEEIKVPLGIVNYEGEMVDYRLEVVSNGEKIAGIESIVLTYGQKWEQAVTFVLTEPAENQEVDFLLFIGTGTEPYRQLRLSMGVMAK